MRIFGPTIALLFTLSACGSAGLDSDDRLVGLSFDLIEFRLDDEVINDAHGWIEFSDEGLEAHDGCNDYGIEGNLVWSTAQGCIPQATQDTANAVGAAVKNSSTWDFDGLELRIEHKGSTSIYQLGVGRPDPPPIQYPVVEAPDGS